jgi:hypothetical protein
MSRRAPRKSKKRLPYIFMSHSSVDSTFARRLVDDLDRLGVDVWLDDWDLDPGDRLRSSVGRGIERSRFFGVVLSPAFLKSKWCSFELERALSKERRTRKRVLLPIVIDSGPLPEWAAERVYVNFRGRYFPGLAELAGMVHRIPRRRIVEGIGKRRFKSVEAVGILLRELGWMGAGLWDAEDFDMVAALKGVSRQGKTVEFVPDEVIAMNPRLPLRIRRLLERAKQDP